MAGHNHTEEGTKVKYAVLLYPSRGVPRVIELPFDDPLKRLKTVSTRAKAEAALERFLSENPEYRRWEDGRIHSATAPKGETCTPE